MRTKGPPIAAILLAVATTIHAASANSQGIPLLVVTSQPRTAAHAAADLASIASITGSSALVGPALASAIETQFATRDGNVDSLRALRERIPRSRRAYDDAVASSQRDAVEAALRALEQDAAALIAQPMALDRSRENREALMNALLFVANVSAQDQPTRAQEAVRTLAEALPDLVLNARAARETVRTMYREHVRQITTASLVVQSTPDGCQVRRNGVSLGNAPAQMQGLVPGQQRVSIRCGGRTSLVHLVNVGAGTTSTVQIDIALDRALEFGDAPTLRYDDARTRDGRSISDVALIASALGADRAIVYRPEERRVAIVDVLARTVIRELAQREWTQLRDALRARASGRSSASSNATRDTTSAPEVRVRVRPTRVSAPRRTLEVTTSPNPSGAQFLVGIVFGAAAVVLAGGGTVAWFGAGLARQEAGLVGRDGIWLGSVQQSVGSAETPLRALAIGGWIAGGGLFAAGATLMALGLSRRQPAAMRAMVTPGGVLVQGAF
jgi:hypothetical protein